MLKRSLTCGAAVGALLLGSTAFAQEAGLETVVVTGYRASLEKSLEVKRSAAEMVDSINAEDIGKFPDANLAESLQRLPGVAVDRDNGEGRTITVRGLNADFTRVTLNGLEALSTAGASSSGDDPNRSRQFDFNTFASELFSNLKVYKSSAAETDEGSLGATVELQTGRPFDTGDKYVLSVQNGTYEYGAGFNPRVAAVASHNFFGGKLGILASIAYNMRNQSIDSYQNKADYSSYVFRSMVFKGSAAPIRYGFAAPTGTATYTDCVNGTVNSPVTSVKIPYAPYCSALQGSNATAYSTLNAGLASSTGASSTVMMPTLATLNHQILYQTRIGGTTSVQWQADEDTLFTLDGVISSTYQKSTNYQLQALGLNRNNTSSNMTGTKLYTTANNNTVVNGVANNANLNTISSNLTAARLATNKTNLAAAYADAGNKCNGVTAAQVTAAAAAGYSIAPVSCLGADYTTFANNMDPYSYYSSGGTNLGAGAAQVIKFLGRPTTQLASVHVAQSSSPMTSGMIDQMTLGNVDISSAANEADYTTQFMQVSLSGEHRFNERARVNASVGMSVSRNHQTGYFVEFDKLDSGTYDGTTCTNCYVYDATAEDADMPSVDYGFDVDNSANWNLVKGYSAFKHYVTNTTNKFRSLKLSAAYDINDKFTFKIGFNGRIYDFNTSKYSRVMKDAYGMPSMTELQNKYGAGFSIGNLGRYVNWGTGLNVPSGTTVTGWFAPDLNQFKNYLHVDCNCVDPDFGDYTVSNQFSAASTSTTGNTYKVSEHDQSIYAQFDLKEIMIFGHELRGNTGARLVMTAVQAVGHGTVGNVIKGSNRYVDLLPSVNLVYSLADDMLIRASAGKAIARPQLATLAPSITSFSIDTTNTDGSSLTIGNTKLKPYHATTIDLGYEWYFDEGAVLAVSGFTKYIKDVPQQVTTSGYLNSYMDLNSYNQLLNVYTNVPGMVSTTNAAVLACSYAQTAGCKFLATTYQNARGGVLNGLEITYQQVLKFLPHPFDGLGINANYTLIHSRMHYIVSPESKPGAGDAVYGDNSWTGASPNAYNVTVFYDGKDWKDRDWSARVSIAYRSKYVSVYPIRSGDIAPGLSVSDSSPIMNEAEYSKSTFNVDTSFTYSYTDYLQFRIDALNLTNQTNNRYILPDAQTVTNYQATGRQIFAGVSFKY